MDFKIIDVKESIIKDNNAHADSLRKELNQKKTLFINVMSSPGSGKTTTLVATINRLKEKYSFGVMEADIDGQCDAETISEKTGARVIQLHTGGMCHLDSEMTRQGMDELGIQGLDVVFLENIGNLVCPAEFDTGAQLNVIILSVPEGDDKPIKYPLMFSSGDVVLINKMDAMVAFDFNTEKVRDRIHNLNPKTVVYPISAKTGEGLEAWIEFLSEAVKNLKKGE